MRFPWAAFLRLAVAFCVGSVGLCGMALVEGFFQGQTMAYMLHQYAWDQGHDFALIGYFTSVGWRSEPQVNLLEKWLERSRWTFWLPTLALLPAVVLVGLNWTGVLDWRWWPADAYVLLTLFYSLGLMLGSVLKRWWLAEVA